MKKRKKKKEQSKKELTVFRNSEFWKTEKKLQENGELKDKTL